MLQYPVQRRVSPQGVAIVREARASWSSVALLVLLTHARDVAQMPAQAAGDKIAPASNVKLVLLME